MKIKAAQLRNQLETEPKPVYWISGDEPLLLQESADLVRRYARDNAFEDREIFHAGRGFDWQQFTQSTSNLSLFADKKLLELRLENARLDDMGKSVLLNYIQHPAPDFIVLITSPRLEAAVMNTGWFKKLEAGAVIVQIWPLGIDDLPDWLDRRLQHHHIKATADALQLLVERVEGNLLAAVQEVEKIRLFLGEDGSNSTRLDKDTVIELVADSSRYNPFTLIDAALAGDGRRVIRIVNGLRNEGAEPLMLVGAVCAELRRLLPMLQRMEDGQSATSVMKSARINFKRTQVVSRALQRMRPDLIYILLDQARKVDYAAKGLSGNDPWIELDNLFLHMSGIRTATSAITQ